MTAYVKRASVAPHMADDRDPTAIALLKEDHQVLRALFDLVETVRDDVLFPVAEISASGSRSTWRSRSTFSIPPSNR